MALSKFQRLVIDTLLEKGDMSIKEISGSTGYSTSFIRLQVELMVAAKELSVDKRRQPYVYEVAAESPELAIRKSVEKAKARIISTEPTRNVFITALRTTPKSQWMEAAETLKAMAQAIEELEADGQLIDTLDS